MYFYFRCFFFFFFFFVFFFFFFRGGGGVGLGVVGCVASGTLHFYSRSSVNAFTGVESLV